MNKPAAIATASLLWNMVLRRGEKRLFPHSFPPGPTESIASPALSLSPAHASHKTTQGQVVGELSQQGQVLPKKQPWKLNQGESISVRGGYPGEGKGSGKSILGHREGV